MIASWATERFTPPFGPIPPGSYPFPGAVLLPPFLPLLEAVAPVSPQHRRIHKDTNGYKSISGPYKAAMTTKEQERVHMTTGSNQAQKVTGDNVWAQEVTGIAYSSVRVGKDTGGVINTQVIGWLGIAVRGEKGHDPGVETRSILGWKRALSGATFCLFSPVPIFTPEKFAINLKILWIWCSFWKMVQFPPVLYIPGS